MRQHIPNMLTLANLTCGWLSILFSLDGAILWASLSLLGAVIFDGLDGRVAKWLSAESELGRELDSLSDFVSFGIAPIILLLSQYTQVYVILASFLVVLGGAYRLARFNAMGKKSYFLGMPIIVNAVVIPLFVLGGTGPVWMAIILAASSLLMVARFKVRKF
jgi:CDP-diacylglycerol--serine O-phosphatidyltransferase